MYSNDYSDNEFEGFLPENIEIAERNIDHIESVNISDVDCSDFTDESSDSEEFILNDGNQDPEIWSEALHNVNIEEFSDNPGPTTQLPPNCNEMDFLNLIFPAELFKTIADETNRYAEQEQEKKNSSDAKWRSTSAEEIQAYIAIHIVMGIVVAPNQEMYFSKDDLFRPTGIHERISRDRLRKLNQYFHVADTSNNPPKPLPGHDRIAHVRPIMEVILDKIKSSYVPHREVSIDEAMIAYTGRLDFKQYVPMKPTRRGIKVWMRADPHNGFVNDFQVYTGKEGNIPEKGLGERVVKDLTKDIWGKYHHVYCDNYFTSIPLFEDLFANRTYACGTIRTNRKGVPHAISRSKLRRQGEVVQRQKNNMVATAWHDKRTVTLLATNSNPLDVTEVLRKQRDGRIVPVPCPRALKQYTLYMNGVDRADQLRSTYNICRKASKWWKYLFWFMVDVSICNAFILMKESINHQISTKNGRTRVRTQLEFRRNLAHQLLGGFRKRKRDISGNAQTRGLMHWPTEFDKKRTCKQCAKKKIRKEPKTGCEQCGVNLCIACFKPYHTENHPDF